MNLKKLIFTENECYKAGKKIKPKSIMVHSTGANNPYLRRYVGPDDGLLGENQYNNHWNQHRPSGRQVCVHAFIGKLKNGTIATYQTLPWDHRGWHAGGEANNSHIGFEICEDNLSDAAYFNAIYKEATELCAHLCKLYNLTEKDIIGHYEGYQKKIASNHGDPRHWFRDMERVWILLGLMLKSYSRRLQLPRHRLRSCIGFRSELIALSPMPKQCWPE